MSQFKPGDEALTLIPLSILPAGSEVVVEQRIRPGQNLGTPEWPLIAMVEGWWCSHSEIGQGLPFAETSLMPLRGDFAPLEQKSQAVPV